MWVNECFFCYWVWSWIMVHWRGCCCSVISWSERPYRGSYFPFITYAVRMMSNERWPSLWLGLGHTKIFYACSTWKCLRPAYEYSVPVTVNSSFVFRTVPYAHISLVICHIGRFFWHTTLILYTPSNSSVSNSVLSSLSFVVCCSCWWIWAIM